MTMLDMLPHSVSAPRHLASSESKPGIGVAGVFVVMVHEDGVLDVGDLDQVIQSKAVVGWLIPLHEDEESSGTFVSSKCPGLIQALQPDPVPGGERQHENGSPYPRPSYNLV